MTRLRLLALSRPGRARPSPPLRLYLHGEVDPGGDAMGVLDLPPLAAGARLVLEVAPVDLDLARGVVVVLASRGDGGAAGIEGAATLTERQLLCRRLTDRGVCGTLSIETRDGGFLLDYCAEMAPLTAPGGAGPVDRPAQRGGALRCLAGLVGRARGGATRAA